jgi:hypothetical protein
MICLALCAAVTAPFFVSRLPPLNDYPSHLARAYILSAIDRSPDLQKYYSVAWQLVPNLGLDLVAPPLAGLIGVENAMAAFTVVSLLLCMTGVTAMHRSLFHRVSLAPLAVFLIAYNRSFLWGFVNYFFALGVCFWLFAAWLRSRGWKRALRLPVFSLAAAVLFILHLHAFATYAVLVAGYELSRALAHRRDGRALRELTAAALQFAPAVLLLALSPTADRADDVEYGSIAAKLTGAIDAFYAYNLPLDAITLALAGSALLAGLALRVATPHRHMLLPVGLLMAAFLLMPTTIFGSFAADRRLATSIWMIAAASIDWRLPAGIARIAGGLLIALILIRTGAVVRNWRGAAGVYDSYLRAFELLPQGARLAAAVAKPVRPFLDDPPIMFIASMAVVERDAFVNTLFAEHGHQPLRLKYLPADVRAMRLSHIFYADRRRGSAWRAGDPFARIEASEYDFVLLINPALFEAEPPARLKLVAREPGRFALYRTASSGELAAAPSGHARPR